MKTQRLLALSLILAGAFGAAHADGGLTRDQVRAETLAAARAGQIPHGDLDQRAAPAAVGVPATRAQVRAELAQAIATGALEVDELGRTQREIEPGRYPKEPVAAGLSRSEVRQELATAIRRGQLPQGDEGRTQADITPQRFAASAHRHAVM